MPRPRKCRLGSKAPRVDYFKPRGVPLHNLTEIRVPVEGYEALRLAEIQGLGREEAAERMKVSRHTFGRVLAEARNIVAQAVVKGMALCIQGGDYEIQADGRTFLDRPVAQSQSDDAPEGDRTAATSGKELNMKTIAVSSNGPSLDDNVDPRFGRAAGFILVDPDTMEFEYLDNGASQARAQGAGIQAAENVAGAGAKVVLTGFVGPKAFQALDAAGIQVGQELDGLTVRQAIEKYQAGGVKMADAPNREGHWQ